MSACRNGEHDLQCRLAMERSTTSQNLKLVNEGLL